MGYYTYYQVEADALDSKEECPTCGHCRKQSQFEAICETVGYNPFEDSCKWYEWKDDMIKHSLKNPGVLFTLDGEGEESGDVWRTYFKDGKMQQEVAEIQLAGFDPAKLK